MRTVIGFAAASVVLGLAALTAADEKESKVDVDDLPEAVLDAIEEEFDDAKVTSAEKGTDDGETFYEVEIKEEGRSIDVVLDGEGEIEEVARAIEADDLPKAVAAALKEKYPRAKIKEAEKVTEYEDDDEGDDDETEGKSDDDDEAGEKEDGDGDDDGEKEDEDGDDDEDEISYEVELVTADGKTLEVEVSADGDEVEVEADGDDGEEAGDDDDKGDGDKKRDGERGEKDDN